MALAAGLRGGEEGDESIDERRRQRIGVVACKSDVSGSYCGANMSPYIDIGVWPTFWDSLLWDGWLRKLQFDITFVSRS